MAIKLSPEELSAQGKQMLNLKNEYEALFNSVSGTLKEVNGNWSEYLSNNFSGKINGAQKSFAAILDTLEFGGNAALKSASTFADLDSVLAKGFDEMKKSVKTEGKSAGDIIHDINSVFNKLEDWKDGIIEDLDKYVPGGKALEWLIDAGLDDEKKVIDGAKDTFEILDSDNVKEGWKCYQVWHEKSNAAIDKGNYFSALGYEMMGTLNISAAYTNGILDAAYEQLFDKEARDMFDGMNFLKDRASDKFSDGDYLGSLSDYALSAGVGLIGVFETVLTKSAESIAKYAGGEAGELAVKGLFKGASWTGEKLVNGWGE